MTTVPLDTTETVDPPDISLVPLRGEEEEAPQNESMEDAVDTDTLALARELGHRCGQVEAAMMNQQTDEERMDIDVRLHVQYM